MSDPSYQPKLKEPQSFLNISKHNYILLITGGMMKKLFFATTLLTLTACTAPNAKAFPRPRLKPLTSLRAPLQERKQPKERTLDIFCSKKETMVLHTGGVKFFSSKERRVSLETAQAKVSSEEAVFNQKALTGKFLKNGSAIVLFENGDLSLLDFKTNSPPTFNLFPAPPSSPPKILVAGNAFWFILVGSPKLVKVEWKGKTDVTVTRFVCNGIKSIRKSHRVVCTTDSCRIFDGSRLLEEIKESK
jgi:hypothetical protein